MKLKNEVEVLVFLVIVVEFSLIDFEFVCGQIRERNLYLSVKLSEWLFNYWLLIGLFLVGNLTNTWWVNMNLQLISQPRVWVMMVVSPFVHSWKSVHQNIVNWYLFVSTGYDM